MGKSIMLFMWGYQSHFRVQLEYRARAVLQSIAFTVNPKALLVGVRTPDKNNGHTVCVEPEDEDWDPRIFFGCADRADSIHDSHPDHSIIYGDEPRMRDKPEEIRKKAVLEAVQEVTSLYDSKNGTSTFCGWPTRIEGYHVVPILQFDVNQLIDYPHLPDPIRLHDWSSPAGLLHSAVGCLLEEARNALGRKEPGRFFDTFRSDANAILRDAGARFCSAITLVTKNIMLQDVFDTLNIISSLPYEGEDAIGQLLFSAPKAEAINVRVHLAEPVPLSNYKLARKLVEMSERDLACLCHGDNGISGLGSVQSLDSDDFFRVVFLGHYKWDLFYKDALVMRTAYGVPQLPLVRLNEGAFKTNVRRIIPSVEKNAIEKLWLIVNAGMEQRHGTMIVVSQEADKEANRLKKQALQIEPVELTPELVRRLSSIDGAILIDPSGICHAIGVILDGMATDAGDPARGARYNSAVRYISHTRSPSICIVVSEDGHVDIMPKLCRQISSAEIEKRISLLRTQNIDNYHKTINWFNNHRFYLTADQCDIVNNELSRIRAIPLEVGEIRLDIPPFSPNPMMDKSYYLPEEDT
ncbi:MAG: DNA integrity scanning protein DisA nucleotide-binding domain protein [Thermodesulfovibrionales bacterium]